MSKNQGTVVYSLRARQSTPRGHAASSAQKLGTSRRFKISKLMKKNDEYTYDSNLNYSITAGNAGNILVIIDQNVRGKIGKYGEIIDSYVLDKNFTN